MLCDDIITSYCAYTFNGARLRRLWVERSLFNSGATSVQLKFENVSLALGR